MFNTITQTIVISFSSCALCRPWISSNYTNHTLTVKPKKHVLIHRYLDNSDIGNNSTVGFYIILVIKPDTFWTRWIYFVKWGKSSWIVCF